jgi:putative spermidine/putrescine transport system ATP-binding protein
MSADVELDRVTIRFGDFIAVNNASLKINGGEFFSILGPSGCGKTTLLRCISGFQEPTEGKVRIGGEDMAGIGANRRPTALIFQNLALFPLMSVAENIGYGLRVRGVPAKERARKAEDLLRLVALPGIGDKRVSALSGGQKQRVAVARALAVEPKVLLLDEPLSALDLRLRQHMRTELRAIQKRVGITFIYITHDQGEALTMSDRVAVFDKGIVQQLDTVDRLYESPCNEFVANFIGDSNRLRGTIADVDGDYCGFHLSDGTRLRGRNIGGARAGSPAVACIRPERMKLAGGAARPGVNALAGEARGLIYFGDHVRMRCGLPEQDECFVKVPIGTEALNTFTPGAPVALEFAPEHLSVFAGA